MPQTNLPNLTIYTDGGCNPNPGPGGWAAILLRPDQPPQELSGSSPKTTNNQMELTAAIESLKTLPASHQIELFTDSNYLRKGITKWLPQWEKQNWQTSRKKGVKNQALWQTLATEIKHHQIDWHWTKGHAGNKWNERADQLARAAIPKSALPLDDQNAIHIFAAASYSGKSKTGGWSVILRYREAEKSFSGQVRKASANQMHLQAAIEGLRAVKKRLPIHLYTSSDYLKNGATIWVKQWRANNWRTKEGKPVSNREQWETLTGLTQQFQIRWHVLSKENLPPEMKQAKNISAGAMRNN